MNRHQCFLHKILDIVIGPTKAAPEKGSQQGHERGKQGGISAGISFETTDHHDPKLIFARPHMHSRRDHS